MTPITDGRGGASLALRDLSKHYDGQRAVDGISLDVARGRVRDVPRSQRLGEDDDAQHGRRVHRRRRSGSIDMDDEPLARLPPHKRNIGMVFQHYALFPHMTVAENVAFPLRACARSSAETQAPRRRGARAGAAASDSPSATRASSRAGSSSASRSRGRSCSSPQLMLMDEPLGALDKKLREQMQLEIKRIHASSASRSST